MRIKLGLLCLLLPLSAFAAAACSDDDSADSSNGGSAPTQAELVERGDYLVNHIAGCPDCHTPRNADGSLDLDNFMAGAECFIDIDPTTEGVGCLSTPNLTNDETGLLNRSDAEIKGMFQNGERPNGEYLHSVMPYWVFGNMTDEDADAVVAYLRTVEPVSHMVPANEAPWDMHPPAAANRIDLSKVPEPESGSADYESAVRGRYLATSAGVCLECHTPENEPGSAEPLMLDKAFSGGRVFSLAPGFASLSANLTQDETGLKGWTKADIVKVLHEGIDKKGEPLCPPMPVGPLGAFGGITDEDANDIAAYILSLPPVVNDVFDCSLSMAPGAGGAPSGAGGAGGAGGN